MLRGLSDQQCTKNKVSQFTLSFHFLLLKVYRSGKDASYSSEEEEEGRKDQAEREETLGHSLALDGEFLLSSYDAHY